MGHDFFYHMPIHSQTRHLLGGLNQGYSNRIGDPAAMRALSLTELIENSGAEDKADNEADVSR